MKELTLDGCQIEGLPPEGNNRLQVKKLFLPNWGSIDVEKWFNLDIIECYEACGRD